VKWVIASLGIVTFLSCSEPEALEPLYRPDLMEIPKGFPEIVFPSDNAFSIARWALGKKLFYDPVMSLDNTVSCVSCHRPDLAFSDQLALSPGVQNRPGTRNAPTLANVAYHPYLTREGGVPTLEMQILVPIQEHNEFDFNIVLLAERLNQDSTYVAMSLEAYDRAPDAFVITRALACFERSLLSGYSSFDQFTQYNSNSAMNAAEVRGMNLFFSEKTNCSHCHSGFNFTNYAFENNGLYEVYEDPGRYRLTLDEADRALFKVPTLRNIALTGPYMHDGTLPSLEAVVEHYQSGGKEHPHKSELIQPLALTSGEKSDLVAFLKALTDETFITNPFFIN